MKEPTIRSHPIVVPVFAHAVNDYVALGMTLDEMKENGGNTQRKSSLYHLATHESRPLRKGGLGVFASESDSEEYGVARGYD